MYMILFLDGVIGVRVGNEFSEESNFHISEVHMKVKLRDSEAGWIVKISEVTEDEQGAQYGIKSTVCTKDGLRYCIAPYFRGSKCL